MYDYNWTLVLISIMVAIFASLVALDIGRLLLISDQKIKFKWIATGSMILGLGIWSMHFIGMLAFQLPIDVTYNLPIVLISVVPALVASALTLYMISLPGRSLKRLTVGALILSSGILSMHYIGMEAMQMEALLRYDTAIWWLSVLIGYAASFMGLYVLFNSAKIGKRNISKVLSAIVIGVGIVLIHYIGMAAAMFTYAPGHSHAVNTGIDHTYLGYGVSAAAFYILSLTYKSVNLDRKILVQARDSELRFQSLIESAHDAIFVTDQEGHIVQWNSGAVRLFGYTQEAIAEKSLYLIIPEELHSSYREFIHSFLTVEEDIALNRTMETTGLDINKNKIPIEVSIGTWATEEGKFLSYIVRDITERKQTEAKIRDLVYLDTLTNLPNRRLFNERLDSTIQRASDSNMPFSLLYLDVDNFKWVNDRLGHPVGDQLLIQVTERLTPNLRPHDTLARLGGDEFIFLLADADQHYTESFAKEILLCFETPFELANESIHVSPSIGISMYPNDGRDSETLVKRADIALYVVKDDGKNNYQFFNAEKDASNRNEEIIET